MDDNDTAEELAETQPVVFSWVYSVLFPLNLVVFAVQVPLSVFNFVLIYRTSLLHPNLKHVLYAQCACFCTFAVAHSIQIFIILRIIVNAQSDMLTPLIDAKEQMHPIILFTIQFGNLLGHALIAERVMATLWARRYEHYRNWWFTIAWFLPMFLFSLYSCHQQILLHSDLENPISVYHLTAGSVISNYFSLALSLLEIIIFSLLGSKNLERYKAWLRSNSIQHNLSERYQLSENVRTARQLAPTISLHFINIIFSTVLPILLYHNLISDGPDHAMDMIMIISLLSQSICNTLIEYTVISRHPILRQNAASFTKRIFAKLLHLSTRNRVQNDATISLNLEDRKRRRLSRIPKEKIATVSGLRNSIGNANCEADKHFTMLKDQWGESSK